MIRSPGLGACFGKTFSRWLIVVAGLGLVLGLPDIAQAQHCFPDKFPGGRVEFDPQPGQIVKPNSCNLLPCYQPELNGAPYMKLADPKCNANEGPCAVQLRIPLKFPGNLQMETNLHSHIYWFRGATPFPGNCLPPELGGTCNPIAVCGMPGIEIVADYGEAYLEVSASCEDLASGTIPETATYSLSAYSCQDLTGECMRKLDVPNLVVSRTKLAAVLKCPITMCKECGACALMNGPAPGDGEKLGPGAALRYQAGGAGHLDWPGGAAWRTTLGRYWSHDYAQRIFMDPDASRVWLVTGDATFREFRDANGDGLYEKNAPSDEYRRLRKTATGWELSALDGVVDRFDATGLWTETADPHGNRKMATYSGSMLTRVDMPDGRHELFTYHSNGKLAAIDEVGVGGTTSRRWSYTWAGDDLVRVDQPDGTALTFLYGDPRLPGYMTRMTLVGSDGSERIEEAWEYDDRGDRVRSWKGDVSATGPNAIEVTSYQFDRPYRPRVVQVTDPMGVVSTYTLEHDPRSSKPRLMQLAGECPTCGTAPNSQAFYEDPSHPLLKTREVDGKGTVTLYTYDANGQVTSRTDAFGTPLQRTTTWEHNGPFPGLVTATEMPSTSGSGSRRTLFTYDAQGSLMSQTIAGVEAGNAFNFTTTHRYNSAGQLEETDPPGYGMQDVTRFAFDPVRGNLIPTTRTDPLIGATSFLYDSFNRRTAVTDPNGVRTLTSYDDLDRVAAVTQEGESPEESLTTRFEFNAFGDLARTILPRGNVIEYSYDAAGRLISIEKKPDRTTPGERTFYTLDSYGHRIREDQQRWDGTVWVTDAATAYEYSSRCHLDKILHSDGGVTEHAYDCNGNLERVWDENHPSNNHSNPATTAYTYDALNRMVATSQPWAGAGGGNAVTRYEYDVQDHLVKVTDAEGNVTRYSYSDRDLMTQQVSEVSGTTEYRYNEHGQLTTETDARGITMSRAVDALDRVTFLDYPEDALDTRYTFDDPLVPFSKGRLTAIIRNGGTVPYRYDRFGRVLQDGALTYGYDANGNRQEIGYPGGVTASYNFDFADREERLVLTEPGQAAKTLAASATYLAGGPLTSLLLGNGLVESRTFDGRYFPSSIRVPGKLDWEYETDRVGNILSIQDALTPSQPRSYAYQDYAYFLTQGNGPWGNQAWTYDKIGNRLTQTADGVTETYSYLRNAAGGNNPKLVRVAPPLPAEPTSYFYDAAGNQTHRSMGEEKLRFSYDSAGRLSQLSSDVAGQAPAQTQLHSDGRSFLSTSTFSLRAGGSPQHQTSATYSSEGLLFHKLTQSQPAALEPRDQPIEERDSYILYFAGRPMALFEKRAVIPLTAARTETRRLLFLTADHLGTPVLATGESGNSAWIGGFSPFGGDEFQASEVGIFLRLPGQWEDGSWASGSLTEELLHNVHRWYDTSIGRYTQPDPLGLTVGDPHPYVYVHDNPVNLVDPLGLKTPIIGSGKFCVAGNCKCVVPVMVLGEDDDKGKFSFVAIPVPKKCVAADAVYTADGVLKIPDNYRCTFECDDKGKPKGASALKSLSCSANPWIPGKKLQLFPPGTTLPPGWPPNPLEKKK